MTQDTPKGTVDSHHHFWDLARFDYDWMPPEPSVLRRNYLPGDLAPILERNGVERTVLVQAHASVEEAEFLLELGTSTAFVAGVVAWVDLTSPNVGTVLDRLSRKGPLVGIRHTSRSVVWIEPAPISRGPIHCPHRCSTLGMYTAQHFTTISSMEDKHAVIHDGWTGKPRAHTHLPTLNRLLP